MSIKSITKNDLHPLSPLLEASFGERLEIQDEIDYFNEELAKSWFYLIENNIPMGFIRCFELEPLLYIGEVYSKQIKYLKPLFEHFLQFNQLPQNIKIRFDIKSNDYQLKQLIQTLFPNHSHKTFLHYQYLNSYQSKKPIQPHDVDLTAIQAILSNLKHYSLKELAKLKELECLYWYPHQVPLSALHLEKKEGQSSEIITLSTTLEARQKGYAQALIKHVLDTHAAATIELKVEDSNLAAIKLYEKMSFQAIPTQNEDWFYLPINPLS